MALFEYRAYSKHPAIKKQAEAFVKLMLKERSRKLPRARVAALIKWMKTAIAGLYLIGGYQRDDVQIPTSRNLYQGRTRRSPMYQCEFLIVLFGYVQMGILK